MIKINLKELMEKNKISINKLSNETGLSRPTLTSLLNNDSKGVQFDTLETLLDYFNISIADLLIVTDREITFYYNELVSMKNLLWAEENTETSKKSKNGFVEMKPSDGFIFDCCIQDTNEETEPFNIMVSPIIKDEKIFVVKLGIYRVNNKKEVAGTADINNFLSKLNDDAIIKLTNSIVSEWLKFYLKLKPFNLFLKSMLFVDIEVIGQKTRIPVVVDINLINGKIKLSYETYKQNSKLINGDDSFSSKITFIHGKP